MEDIDKEDEEFRGCGGEETRSITLSASPMLSFKVCLTPNES